MLKRWFRAFGAYMKLFAAFRAHDDAMIRYRLTGDPGALDHAITLLRKGLAVTPIDHPRRFSFLTLLGTTLLLKYEQVTMELGDLTEAVDVARQAVAATPINYHPDPGALSGLGAALRLLGEQTQDLEVLTEAVTVGQQAVAATPTKHPSRAVSLASLGVSLQLLYQQTQKLEILTEAVTVGRQAMAAALPYDLDRAEYLTDLGGALQLLSQRTAKLKDLTETVTVARQAVAATPAGHPSRPINLANLGIALQLLYEQTHDLKDLTEAVTVGRQAVAATPPKHPNRAGFLNNLGSALWQLYRRIGELRILIEAAAAQREAAAAIPTGHVYRARYISNLGVTLQELSERTPNLTLLNEVVAAQREAVAVTSADHPDRARYLNALGLALRHLFDQNRELTTLIEAVTVGRQAVAATAADHPDRAMYQNNLGLALWHLFEETEEATALTDARDTLADAASSPVAAITVRLVAGSGLAIACMSAGDPRAALAALEGVVALIPQVAPRALRRSDREYRLSQLAGLSTQVAAAATAAGQPERAIKLLEQTRGLLMGEVIDARSDLTELRLAAPELAADFDNLREQITGSDDAELSLRPLFEPSSVGWGGRDGKVRQRRATDLAERRRHLAREWAVLLERIRAREGFEQFLLQPSINRFCDQAAEGPIAIVYASRWRADALIITPDPIRPVRVVPLPGLTETVAAEQASRLLTAWAAADKAARGSATWVHSQDEIHASLSWLWDTITGPILIRLGFTGVSGQRPRIWWCPIGVCINLPLHAAGHHIAPGNDSMPATVMDRVTSSYIPTIRALEYARARRDPSHAPADSALIVAMPTTPGARDLPEAATEAEQLTRLLGSPLVLQGPAAQYQAVIAALPKHRIAHFACHGRSNRADPSTSHLLLFDHVHQPLTVMSLSRLHLAAAELAYLSSCSTTQTNVALADEAVHITAAFLLAGYRRVIGTLWPVNDTTATIIAKYVYTHLTGDGTHPPRLDDSACALAQAIRLVRDASPTVPTQWAAHLHLGA